jgi:hypothetical protein
VREEIQDVPRHGELLKVHGIPRRHVITFVLKSGFHNIILLRFNICIEYYIFYMRHKHIYNHICVHIYISLMYVKEWGCLKDSRFEGGSNTTIWTNIKFP